MIYHAHERDLDFVLGGKRYVVPMGAEVEIPDALKYAVKSNGLALKEGPSGGERVASRRIEKKFRPMLIDGGKKPTRAEIDEELADITGEDPLADDDEGDAEEAAQDVNAVQKAAEQLERQGIVLPGRKPRKRSG